MLLAASHAFVYLHTACLLHSWEVCALHCSALSSSNRTSCAVLSTACLMFSCDPIVKPRRPRMDSRCKWQYNPGSHVLALFARQPAGGFGVFGPELDSGRHSSTTHTAAANIQFPSKSGLDDVQCVIQLQHPRWCGHSRPGGLWVRVSSCCVAFAISRCAGSHQSGSGGDRSDICFNFH